MMLHLNAHEKGCRMHWRVQNAFSVASTCVSNLVGRMPPLQPDDAPDFYLLDRRDRYLHYLLFYHQATCVGVYFYYGSEQVLGCFKCWDEPALSPPATEVVETYDM